MKILFLFLTLFSMTTFAAESSAKKHKHGHREHEAHAHGTGSLAIAFEDVKGKVEFKAAAEGILGFEHLPKNPKDKKTLDEAVLQFETNIGKMVQLDPSLNCQFTRETVGQVPEEGDKGSGEHSDWVANFSVTCAKSPVGSKITIDFSRFKLLKDLDVTVLAGSVQKSAEFKKNPITIELK